jgi:hypothetical protein
MLVLDWWEEFKNWTGCDFLTALHENLLVGQPFET